MSMQQRRRQWTMALWTLLLWIASMGLMAEAQTTGSRLPPLVIKSLGGPDLFRFYCASCHGETGAGNGPVAAGLKNPPTNLTLLARSNGGVFPRDQVWAVIAAGEPVKMAPAHGSREMPVWGDLSGARSR